MPLNSVQAKRIAKSQVRDAQGHFIKKSGQIRAKVSVDSPADAISPEQSRGVKLNPEFEKPLVSVSVNNPFKKILYWLDQIRKHQTTTFALKLSIPLIALPVVVLGVFSLGRVYGINFQKAQQEQPAPIVRTSPLPDPLLSRAGTLKVAVGNQTRYLLSLKNGELVVLEIPPTINLVKYKDKQVLVTGTYSKTANIIKVQDIAEVQIFNPTVIPEASFSAAPQS